MECCGKKISTKFCPDCGSQIGGDYDLISLLRHVESQSKAKQKTLQQLRVDCPHPSWLRRAEKAAARWGGWAKALRDCIENADHE